MFALHNLTANQKKLRRRILELSFRHGYSHISSCLCAVDIIDSIHRLKKKDEPFVLSNGHAGVALYAVLEKYKLLTAEQIEKLFIHPDRDAVHGIHVSSGSLGQGLPIAVGMTLADRKKHVYCLFSDGECAEGSIWEGLRVASEQQLINITFVISANGWGAYKRVSLSPIRKQCRALGFMIETIDGHDAKKLDIAIKKSQKKKTPMIIFAKTTVEQLPFLHGQAGHYHKMNEEEYKAAAYLLK